MQVVPSDIQLVSLLIVFLSENYEHRIGVCDSCGASRPQFGKTFLIGPKWVCVECVMKRINEWD
ncbi:MAG: hypothetical protein KAR33_04695 [Candidatus Thorarchaeota archaeon]|nr:hypothetical protein [Candidatus Thorarchaeota archaeon]